MISLPRDYKVYINIINERCKDLIELKFWEGIDNVQFDKWRKNFKSEEEKYFCACLLDSLIYRSNKQTYSLIFHLLKCVIPNEFRKTNPALYQTVDFPSCMTIPNDPNIRFVACELPDDPPTKSTTEILRFYKRHFNIKEKWIISPRVLYEHYCDGIRNFIFIDDFVGTGQQFNDVIDKWGFSKYFKDCYIMYAPLVAHEKGIDRINSHNSSKVSIAYCELMSSTHSFFSRYFSDNGNTPEIAKNFYKNIFESRGIRLDDDHLYGWGKLELTFSFEHATPDNSLPVFYHKTNWEPLFNR